MDRVIALRRRVTLVGALLVSAASACTIDVDHPIGRKCDADRPCSEPRLCIDGFCAEGAAEAGPPCGQADLQTAPNLVANDSFEVDTSGWEGRLGASLARVSPGLSGAFALEVSTPADANEFGVEDDTPHWVEPTPGPGAHYCFSAWVRSTNSDRRVRIRVREYFQGTQQGASSHSRELSLTSTWRRLDVPVQTVGPAGGSLEMQITVIEPAPANHSFELDAVSIRAAR